METTMKPRGLPANQETQTVWSLRPSTVTERVVDRLVAERGVSRSQLLELAIRSTFWSETVEELEAVHGEEMKRMADIKLIVPSMEVQRAVAKTLDTLCLRSEKLSKADVKPNTPSQKGNRQSSGS